MDDYLMESDEPTPDIDDDVIDPIHVPPVFENEAESIEYFSKRFQQRYDACPVFFMGTLQNACQEAFSPKQTEDRRPVLIYIYNDDNLLSKDFSKTILCSTKIMDYLLNNYIVWPWDIQFKLSRNNLAKIWENLFSINIFDNYPIEECPLLIGITRLFQYEIDGSITAEYKLTPLLKRNTLIRTKQTVNREALLNELCNFKNECDKNENFFLFNFVKITGLCWEIILEIAKYLSLNDAISAFSPSIISLLNNPELKFQLSDPSPIFLKLVQKIFKSEQIVSLRINENQKWSKTDLSIFKNVISLTLLNQSYEQSIIQYQEYLPKLTTISFCYDTEMNFTIFHTIFGQLTNQIKRLEIHSAGTFCPHYMIEFERPYSMNWNIEYFIFDIGHFPLISINDCYKHYESCFLKTITNFIQRLVNIRYIHLIINANSIKQLLDLNEWETVMKTCLKLEKIILQVLESISENDYLIQRASIIQTELCHIRENIKFRIIFL